MEKQKKSAKVRFPAILWAFIAFALCTAQTSRAGYISESGPIYDPPQDGSGYYWVTAGATVDLYASGSYWVYIDEECTVNFQTGSMASYVFAFSGSQLNMYGGTITETINAQADVDLKIYGTYDSMVSDTIGEGHWDGTINQLVVDDTEQNGWNGDLTFTYEGDSATTTLSFSTLSNITVEAGGGGPITVQIDIKPGSDQNNINLKSKGVVPVAVLTTGEFDAATIDPATAEFAGAKPEHWNLEDVDGDGDDDIIIFHFRTQELELDQDSTEATLTALLLTGEEVSGTDQVRIVPSKK
jgi:hypothetical protein